MVVLTGSTIWMHRKSGAFALVLPTYAGIGRLKKWRALRSYDFIGVV